MKLKTILIATAAISLVAVISGCHSNDSVLTPEQQKHFDDKTVKPPTGPIAPGAVGPGAKAPPSGGFPPTSGNPSASGNP